MEMRKKPAELVGPVPAYRNMGFVRKYIVLRAGFLNYKYTNYEDSTNGIFTK